MNPSAIIIDALKPLWWLIPIAVAIGIFKSPWFKGVFGEALVKFAAKIHLPSEIYHPIHNVTLSTPDGTTQIDHIFVSRYGIFVVETKNMKGWILGNEDQAQWTQKIYQQSIKFQSPLRQNYKHVKALESALAIPTEAIHSVVVFVGNSKFKTEMPPNVTIGSGYITYIKSFNQPVLTETQVHDLVAAINTGRLTPSFKTHRQHVADLKSRFETSTPRKCPKCDSNMVLRTAKQGPNAGRQFWACSTYPKCKTVQNVT